MYLLTYSNIRQKYFHNIWARNFSIKSITFFRPCFPWSDITITYAVLVLRPCNCRVRWCNIETYFLLLKKMHILQTSYSNTQVLIHDLLSQFHKLIPEVTPIEEDSFLNKYRFIITRTWKNVTCYSSETKNTTTITSKIQQLFNIFVPVNKFGCLQVSCPNYHRGVWLLGPGFDKVSYFSFWSALRM